MKAHKIQIPNPCSQEWKEMTPRSGGRHCESCNTVVTDFTKMSDSRIYYHLSQPNGSTCGRLKLDQLNRVLQPESYRNGPDLLGVVLGMTLLLSSYPVQANETYMSFAPITLIDQLNRNEELKDGHEPIIVRFRIIDEQSLEPIPAAKVFVQGENDAIYARVLTDFDGYGTIELSPDQLESAKTLMLSAYEYGKTTIEWNDDWESGGTCDIKFAHQYSITEMEMIGAIRFTPVNKRKAARIQRRESRRERKSND